MYPGLTLTKFGRIQSVAPLQLHRLHVHRRGSRLREVQHEVPVPVLDQEDLVRQGINTAHLISGAATVDALGSCTCQAGTAHLAERMAAAGREVAGLGAGWQGITLDLRSVTAKSAEEFAIVLYHLVTDQTGNPATEWPPADCGSSGYYVCSELERLGLASSYKTGAGVHGALSLLQSGTVMQGGPWFNSWFQPDSQGYVDGDGSLAAFEHAIASGVAGGHETLQTGIPQLARTVIGTVDLDETVIRVRNSWGKGWGPLGGDYLIHASTLAYLTVFMDFKTVVI